MVHSPSKVWVDGVLVERAISTGSGGADAEREPEEFVSGTKPYKTPVPTKYGEKRVAEAENKAVRKASKKSK